MQKNKTEMKIMELQDLQTSSAARGDFLKARLTEWRRTEWESGEEY